MRPAGACGFPVDPELDAFQAQPFWRADIAPAVVIQLGPAAASVSRPIAPINISAPPRLAEEGAYVLLRNGLQVLLTSGATLADPLAVVLPLDAEFPVRAAAAHHLYRSLAGEHGGPDPLTAQRRGRLARMLRTLDARAEGASYRDVAEHVLGAPSVDSLQWRTSTFRDVAIRLSRGALALMRGGYRALLRRRR